MQIYLTRDSVAAGDDIDAPHDKIMTFPNGTSLEAIITHIARSGYLASIQGGKATWSAISKIPLAVVAQQWDAPKMLVDRSVSLQEVDTVEGGFRLHFRYYTQQDPDAVFERLQSEVD